MSEKQQSVDLYASRVADILVGTRHYRLTFKIITQQEWKKYFSGVISTAERTDQGLVQTFDTDAAAVDLVSRNLTDIAGYNFGGRSLPEIKDWQQLVPAGHRLGAARFLRNATVQSGDDEEVTLGLESVHMLVFWTCDAEGKANGVKVAHHFRSPTSDHQRRVRLAMSKSSIEGTGRSGRTRYHNAGAELMQVYDELIDSVDGYSWGPATERPTADDIRSTMDGFHKVLAAGALFQAAEVQEQE